MRRSMKWLLSGCLLFLLFGAGVAVLTWRFVSSNKDAWLSRGTEALAEGERAGRDLDERACLDTAISRLKEDGSFGTGLGARLWLSGCLNTSRQADGFCDKVPPPTEIMKTIEWSASACLRYGLGNNSGCTGLMQQTQKHCAEAGVASSP